MKIWVRPVDIRFTTKKEKSLPDLSGHLGSIEGKQQKQN
jgi:hypothetical protein